ncbi:MAG: ChaB family protein [Mycobacteriales bacterium]
MPGYDSLPDTLRRSPEKAQRTWVKTHDSALKTYGDGARAHRAAYAALKHSYEKVGDHWEAKPSRGPSDQRSHSGGSHPKGKSHGGVNAEASKEHLYKVAQKLGIDGRSSMRKEELVEAIEKANRRETTRARD